jgi:hypothetical protein
VELASYSPVILIFLMNLQDLIKNKLATSIVWQYGSKKSGFEVSKKIDLERIERVCSWGLTWAWMLISRERR